MDARFYNSDEIDIERLARDLVNAYLAQGYQAQNIGSKDQMLVQLKKGSDFEAIIGMQAALSLTIQKTSGGVLAMIGQQRWIDKAAVGAVGIVAMPILWPLAVTAGVGVLRQASLGNQVLNMVDGLVRQQVPEAQAGPVPYNVMPQVQQHYTPPPVYTSTQPVPAYVPPQPVPQPQPAFRPQTAPAPAPQQLRCSNCNTPYDPGDTFCTGCGRSLTPPRLYCSKCNSEVKPDAAFCPKCGSSTFHTASGSQQVAPTPAPAPTPIVTYTPVQQKPSTPAYTPPQKPPKPEEPLYVPQTTQTPAFVPQPKVTIVQGQKQEAPAPSAPPPRPQKVYYTPSSQAQQAETAAQPAQDQQASTSMAQTLPAQPAAQETPYYTPSWNSQPTVADQSPQSALPGPAAQSASDSDVPWGTLILANGERVQLKGERAVVGRADHDLSDDQQPQVDLSNQQGADTVSRMHAVLEHVGSTYTLTDLNSTNATCINNKRLEPDKSTPINDGDMLQFGKVTSTFKKL
jgi:FHA domain/Double zinc ribbon